MNHDQPSSDLFGLNVPTTRLKIPIEDVKQGDCIKVTVPGWRLSPLFQKPEFEGEVEVYGRAGIPTRMSDRRIGITVYISEDYSYSGRWTPGSMVWVQTDIFGG